MEILFDSIVYMAAGLVAALIIIPLVLFIWSYAVTNGIMHSMFDFKKRKSKFLTNDNESKKE